MMEPVLRPVGFNWQIDVALVPGVAAREVAVAALGTVYAIEGGEQNREQLGSTLAAHWSLATALALVGHGLVPPITPRVEPRLRKSRCEHIGVEICGCSRNRRGKGIAPSPSRDYQAILNGPSGLLIQVISRLARRRRGLARPRMLQTLDPGRSVSILDEQCSCS
jgi:hypothetical protein